MEAAVSAARKVARRVQRAREIPLPVLGQLVAARTRTSWRGYAEPRFAARFDGRALLDRLGASSIDELWTRLAERPFAADTSPRGDFPDAETLRRRAAAARRREVDLLGSGPTQLGTPIEWLADFKSGYVWPLEPARKIRYADLGRPNDVKVPWELSRLQWLIPVGQAYLVDQNDDDAIVVRELIDEWLDANPYLLGVNWACTMDVALRLITLTWLFHVFAASHAWRDPRFRERTLVALHLHGRFIEQNLERSDVNGNHLTADLAGLVFAGEFFDEARWSEKGWRELDAELPRQVTSDGVDFEMSTAYHRLVTELFLLPALYRLRIGKRVGEGYRSRLLAMADFAEAYRRTGAAPIWGDTDDARVLPFGGQAIADHGYLPGLVRASLGGEAAASSEAFWLLGRVGAATSAPRAPRAFPDGGVYVLSNERDHVFVDCGPVGLAGRGGHGHNDCLSFDAVLDGVHLFVDCGSYLYTSSVEWRNRFRSTAFHNTPRVDDEEQNRFVSAEHLWNLHFDARPSVLDWAPGGTTTFRGAHSGYERLADPVRVERSIALDGSAHRLTIEDNFYGAAHHVVRIPYHLSPEVELAGDRLVAAGGRFTFVVEGEWELERRNGWFSPSYGVKVPTTVLELVRSGSLAPVRVTVEPDAR